MRKDTNLVRLDNLKKLDYVLYECKSRLKELRESAAKTTNALIRVKSNDYLERECVQVALSGGHPTKRMMI